MLYKTFYWIESIDDVKLFNIPINGDWVILKNWCFLDLREIFDYDVINNLLRGFDVHPKLP